MKRSIPIVVLVASGALAVTETSDAQETALFSQAQIDIQQALSIATDRQDGNVSSIEFESEDGGAIWEAVIVSADGSLSEIVIDANDGTVIAQGPYMDDDEKEEEENDDRD